MPLLRSSSLATIAVVVVAGCGAGGPLPSPTGPPASGSPPASPTPPADCPNFVKVVETGPLAGDDGTEDGPVAREQRRLEADVQAAIAYGAAHPDEFGSIRFENGPRVRIVIGFTARLEEHCAALRAILEYPDEFEIIRQPATAARLGEIQREIVTLAGNRMRSVGIGSGTVNVQLRPDAETLAGSILAAYGDLVRITLGLLPYPDRFAGDPVCPPIGTIATDTPLVAVTTLEAAATRPGEDFRGTVTVTNSGPVAFDFQSGPTQTAVVYELGGDAPSGFYTGSLDAIGFGKRLAPGESVDLEVVGGTASCDPALGYALPPGAYEVRVPVVQLTMRDAAPTEVSYVLSEPVPLTVVPPLR